MRIPSPHPYGEREKGIATSATVRSDLDGQVEYSLVLGLRHSHSLYGVFWKTPEIVRVAIYYRTMRATLKPIALALALCLHIDVASAQSDAQPAPVLESIPGVMVMPQPPMLPDGQQPGNQDAQTCPATDQKKLELIG